MSKKITPVDKYMLRNEIIQIPGVWVCGKGVCLPISEINKALDDIGPLSKEQLADYILRAVEKKHRLEDKELADLNTLLGYNEVREYIGMKPIGVEDYLEVENDADDEV